LQVVQAPPSITDIELEELISEVTVSEIGEIATITPGATNPFIPVFTLTETPPIGRNCDETVSGQRNSELFLIILC
jgi:hypothetical protein